MHEKPNEGQQTGDMGSKMVPEAEKCFHNLFHAILSSSLPQNEKQPQRMAHEGFEILLAGSDTTARTMGIATYHLIANPHIVQKLREELKTVMPNTQDTIEIQTLLALPGLVSNPAERVNISMVQDMDFCLLGHVAKSSIVKESLRIGGVTDHRLSLIATDETLHCQDWTIPPGVSSTSWTSRRAHVV